MKMPNVKYQEEKYIGIDVSYDPAVKKVTTFKTSIKDIQEGSLVAVPSHTRHNVSVCKVMKVGVPIMKGTKEIIREI